jgi:hypothetical protein
MGWLIFVLELENYFLVLIVLPLNNKELPLANPFREQEP